MSRFSELVAMGHPREHNRIVQELQDRLVSSFPGLLLEFDRDLQSMATIICASFTVNGRRFISTIQLPWNILERFNEPSDLVRFVESRLRQGLVDALQDPQSAPEEPMYTIPMHNHTSEWNGGYMAILEEAKKEISENEQKEKDEALGKHIKTRKIRLSKTS